MKRSKIHLPMAALILAALAIPAAAQQQVPFHNPVTMMFSGDGGASAINLTLPNTRNGEENLAGNGTLGPFTFRLVRATATSSQPSSACSGVFFATMAGAGLFRFQDGSLLKAKVTGGGDCVDLVQGVGHCTLTFQIAGGTGRFEGASGDLTLIETALPVVDASGAPVFFTETGECTGTVSGVAMEEESQDARR